MEQVVPQGPAGVRLLLGFSMPSSKSTYLCLYCFLFVFGLIYVEYFIIHDVFGWFVYLLQKDKRTELV